MDELFIYPKNIPDNILAFTSKKKGIIGNKKVSSFNVGIYTDDTTENILKNIEILKNYHNINKLCFLKQVHKNKVIKVTTSNYKEVFLSEADGLFTEEKELAIGIFTADCYPILLVGNKSIAALHCGWKSLNSGIIEESIKLFNEIDDYPKYAYIGSGICGNCYEIKSDMITLLNQDYNPEKFILEKNNKFYLDLKKLLENVLIINNIKNYEFSEECSSCSENLFSYRRDLGNTGRMITVVMRK